MTSRAGHRTVVVAVATASWVALAASSCAGPSSPPARVPLRGHASPAQARVRPASPEALADAFQRGDFKRVLIDASAVDVTPAIRRMVRRAVDAADLATLEATAPEIPAEAFPGAWVWFRLGLLREHVGRRDAAAEAYARVGGELAVTAKARRQVLVDETRVASPPVVAVLLPLSGPYGGIGRGVRAAIDIAAAERGDAVRFVYHDTEGKEETAAEVVDQAVRAGAAVVLGPVGEHESRAAAARAAEDGIPIALLSPAIEKPGPGVFRLVTSPLWEARAAAKMARVLGFKTAGVLAPRDEHGDAAANAFVRVATALGIRVLADGRYDPTGTDLEPDIKAFFGLDPARNPRLRRYLRRHGKSGWKSYSPDVPFELLYVPDDYRLGSLVASYLPYYSIEVRTRDLMDAVALRQKHGGRLPSVVQLMGPSSWHHPGLIPAGGGAVEGALVIDVTGGATSESLASGDALRFRDAFEERVGRPPSSLEVQAHDAALLVDQAARASGAGGRDAVSRALSRAQLSTGICGPVRVGPGREIEREILMLRVEAGDFVAHGY